MAGLPFNIVVKGGDMVELYVGRASSPTYNRRSTKRIKSCRVLIIDEISMLSKFNFMVLNKLFKRVKNNSMPMGGCQLLVFGDFLQLPPVGSDGIPFSSKYCFESDDWKEIFDEKYCIVHLDEIYRQTDPHLKSALNRLRFGQLTSEDIASFTALSRPLADRNGILPTRLAATNEEADEINKSSLAAIEETEHVYLAEDFNRKSHNEFSPETTFAMVPTVLKLRKGAQVMCLKNDSNLGLVNGTRGVVVDIVRPDKLDGFITLRTLEGITVVITMATWEVKDEDDDVIISRKQFPLRLAWAITMHKSQGMTIDYLDVDLSRVFAEGQTYVALSRAKTSEGLRIRHFNPSKVKTNPVALKFYEDDNDMERANKKQKLE